MASRVTKKKGTFTKMKFLVTRKLDLNLMKKPIKCYISNMDLEGVQTCTLRTIDDKHLASCELCCWGRMGKISWTNLVKNEEELRRVKEDRSMVHKGITRKVNWVIQILRRNYLLQLLNER